MKSYYTCTSCVRLVRRGNIPARPASDWSVVRIYLPEYTRRRAHRPEAGGEERARGGGAGANGGGRERGRGGLQGAPSAI
eukprot:1195673-Prorocentrum_minimum.AAC.2